MPPPCPCWLPHAQAHCSGVFTENVTCCRSSPQTGLFVLSYIGLGISFYPHIVPPKLTIWEAAAPDVSLKFLIVGAVVLVPLILAYTALSYWVFRGKVDPDAGYH